MKVNVSFGFWMFDYIVLHCWHAQIFTVSIKRLPIRLWQEISFARNEFCLCGPTLWTAVWLLMAGILHSGMYETLQIMGKTDHYIIYLSTGERRISAINTHLLAEQLWAISGHDACWNGERLWTAPWCAECGAWWPWYCELSVRQWDSFALKVHCIHFSVRDVTPPQRNLSQSGISGIWRLVNLADPMAFPGKAVGLLCSRLGAHLRSLCYLAMFEFESPNVKTAHQVQSRPW